MKIVCAWCNRDMGERAGGHDITHGICTFCKAQLMDEMRQIIISMERYPVASYKLAIGTSLFELYTWKLSDNDFVITSSASPPPGRWGEFFIRHSFYLSEGTIPRVILKWFNGMIEISISESWGEIAGEWSYPAKGPINAAKTKPRTYCVL